MVLSGREYRCGGGAVAAVFDVLLPLLCLFGNGVDGIPLLFVLVKNSGNLRGRKMPFRSTRDDDSLRAAKIANGAQTREGVTISGMDPNTLKLHPCPERGTKKDGATVPETGR